MKFRAWPLLIVVVVALSYTALPWWALVVTGLTLGAAAGELDRRRLDR